ncbi:MAG: pyruvate kinase, partial [Chloroflexota bacterium]|nr:pyruvate kinase [Chloroflexota bacterium]
MQAVRSAATQVGSTVAVLLDIPGPKYRTGLLKEGKAELHPGTAFVLTTKPVIGDNGRVSVNLNTLPRDVRAGDTLLLSDGEIDLLAEEISSDEVRCQVRVGGTLRDTRALVIPGRPSSSPFVTELTLKQLDFGIEHQVDYFALSFVQGPEDMAQVRQILKDKGADIPLVAKIETGQAVAHLDQIIAASDSVMVARGDMGAELPLEKVPLIQKQIVRKCNRLGKPVIVATQMLESMIQAPRPTRAEVADVFNAVFDGTDAVMLSGETSIGRYPVEATAMMWRIAAEAEAALPYERLLAERGADLEPQTDDAISFDACHTAQQLGAAAIIAFTESGSTARRVAKYRPKVPLLVLTPSEAVRRKLALVWGVRAYIAGRPATVDDMFAQAIRLAKEQGAVAENDLVVITAGVPIGVAGTTNLLKVQRVD